MVDVSFVTRAMFYFLFAIHDEGVQDSRFNI